jgi:hypothetical protein
MTRIAIIAAASASMLWTGAAWAQSQAADPRQPAAGSYGSFTARHGVAPYISPNDPAYAENGAPRVGQPSGWQSAGAPSPTGNYSPIQHNHRDRRGGTSGGNLR